MIPAIILVLSAAVHLFRFGFPPSVVFDEVFYGNFVSNYWQGTYFFDLHPPLFKIFLAFVGKIFGISHYSADWSSIGNALPTAIVDLRIIPVIAGTLLPLVIYALCRRLDFSKTTSFLASTIICLENSLIVQSRYLLPDTAMLLLGFSAILFYLEYRRCLPSKHSPWFFAFSAIAAAGALSIKWTGLTFLFLIFVMETFRAYEESKNAGFVWWPSLKKLLAFSFYFLTIAIFIYSSLFAIHFSTLSYSGTGDAFMSQRFQSGLIGNTLNFENDKASPESFFDKIVELNHTMYSASAGMTATHPYSSKWYTWPVMQRPIFYWQSPDVAGDSCHSYIYLLGNPLAYWLGALSSLTIVVTFVLGLFLKRFRLEEPRHRKILSVLAVGYLVNLLPFIFIGRVMFLYHYETALVISIISIAFLINFLNPKRQLIATVLIITIALYAFVYWSPLTYGIPINEKQLSSMMWLSSWR